MSGMDGMDVRRVDGGGIGMKKLLLVVGWLVLMAVVRALGADVRFSYADFGQTAQGRRNLYVYPVLVAATNAAGIVTGDRIESRTGTDGSVVISNLMAGWLRGEFKGVWRTSTNWFRVPETNGTVLARDCLVTNVLVGGTFPWMPNWAVAAGSGVTVVTNADGSCYTVSATAGGGGITNLQTGVTLSGAFNVTQARLFNAKPGDPPPAIDWGTVNEDGSWNSLATFGLNMASDLESSAPIAAPSITTPTLNRVQNISGGYNEVGGLGNNLVIAAEESSNQGGDLYLRGGMYGGSVHIEGQQNDMLVPGASILVEGAGMARILTYGPIYGDGVGLTNMLATNLVGRAVYGTNANNGRVIDATLPYQVFVTNATFTVSGFSGLVSGRQHLLSMTVSNSLGSEITWNGPPTAFYIGSSSSAARSIPAGKEAVVSFWIWSNVRTNVCNAVQQ